MATMAARIRGGRTLGLFWQIVVFLIVAAALGFVIGWVLRGARTQGAQFGAAPRHADAEAGLSEERERLRTELQAAREAQRETENSLVELRQLADARAGRVHELEQLEASSRERIASLEQELSAARAAGHPQDSTLAIAAVPPAQPDLLAAVPPPAEPVRGAPPPPLPAPEGEPDDLKLISGIGPTIERTLHALGIYHFRQIAELSPDNVAWIDQRLRFRGRIQREDWIGQAQRLARGEAIDQA
jgi:predicted flap endonuclease-1-like 5' DNA nuclease